MHKFSDSLLPLLPYTRELELYVSRASFVYDSVHIICDECHLKAMIVKVKCSFKRSDPIIFHYELTKVVSVEKQRMFIVYFMMHRKEIPNEIGMLNVNTKGHFFRNENFRFSPEG
jgi:hypothetical protein